MTIGWDKLHFFYLVITNELRINFYGCLRQRYTLLYISNFVKFSLKTKSVIHLEQLGVVLKCC